MPRFPMVIPMTHVEHLDDSSMAAYLEGTCDPEDCSRIEAHLAECSECCGELVALDQTIRTLPSRKRGRIVLPLLALGAAAAIGAFIVLRPGDRLAQLPAGSPPIVQRSRPEALTSIVIVDPASGASVAAGEVVLRWTPVEPEARYLVTVTTSEGDSVWALLTPDSAAAIPVALDPGGEYLWYVDALLPGGGTASSGIHHFRVVP